MDVPGDVVVTGFDGIDMANVFWPTLTTVVQPTGSIAADAVAFLLNRIEGRLGSRSIRFARSMAIERSVLTISRKVARVRATERSFSAAGASDRGTRCRSLRQSRPIG